MEYIYLLIFLLSPVITLAGLIKPAFFSKLLKRNITRRNIVFIGLISIITSFVAIGATAEPTQEESVVLESSTENVTPKAETEVSSLSIDTANAEAAKILRIVDGDTIEVSIDAKTEKIRVIGIDTPETVDPRKSVECMGMEASNKAKELLKVGNEVYLESDPSQDNRDKYSRLLRYIWINENLDFGKLMIEEGYAYEYTYDLPYKYQESYKRAQKKAEEDKKGLWAEGVCISSPTPTTKQAYSNTTQSTPKPTSTPITNNVPTNTPTVYIPPTTYIAPTSPPSTNTGGSWTCDCSKTCPNMSTCEEAYFQLNSCGCSIRDGDNDGVPCENICLGG